MNKNNGEFETACKPHADHASYRLQTSAELTRLDYTVFGEGVIEKYDDVECVVYRDAADEKMTMADHAKMLHKVVRALGIDQFAHGDTLVEILPITMAEILDDGKYDEEIVLGYDIVFRQQVDGIPLEGNFIRVCLDVKGVYQLINSWKRILRESLTDEVVDLTSGASVSDKAIALYAETIGVPTEHVCVDDWSYIYVSEGDGIYSLCHLISLADDEYFYADAISGIRINPKNNT